MQQAQLAQSMCACTEAQPSTSEWERSQSATARNPALPPSFPAGLIPKGPVYQAGVILPVQCIRTTSSGVRKSSCTGLGACAVPGPYSCSTPLALLLTLIPRTVHPAGGHSGTQADTAIAIALTAAGTAAGTTVCPGQAYSVSVGPAHSINARTGYSMPALRTADWPPTHKQTLLFPYTYDQHGQTHCVLITCHTGVMERQPSVPSLIDLWYLCVPEHAQQKLVLLPIRHQPMVRLHAYVPKCTHMPSLCMHTPTGLLSV